MLREGPHSKYDLEYHLVFVTKYRHPVIDGSLEKDLITILRDLITGSWGLPLSEINADKDHIHILLEIPPHIQISKLVNNLKTVSSRRIRKLHAASLTPYYWKPYFWSQSYFVCTVSERSRDAVSNYIRNQGS